MRTTLNLDAVVNALFDGGPWLLYLHTGCPGDDGTEHRIPGWVWHVDAWPDSEGGQVSVGVGYPPPHVRYVSYWKAEDVDAPVFWCWGRLAPVGTAVSTVRPLDISFGVAEAT